jgi:ParB-like chromosome segregation protein Spo0J
LETPPTSGGPKNRAIESTSEQETVVIPIMSILPGESPRLNGEDKAHIARLAETEAELPPILVHRPSMQVIDGMHRLMAASLQGHKTIRVRFFNGSEADVFLWAVRENVRHGLPLSRADRRAATERIIGTHPRMSDRAIGELAGLAAKTVAAIRRSSGDASQSNARLGKDGRVRPLNGEKGRLRAAEILSEQPEASLREVAKAAGIAPATVLDVRNRLARGESPVPTRPDRSGPSSERSGPDRSGPGSGSERSGSERSGPGFGPERSGPVSNGAEVTEPADIVTPPLSVPSQEALPPVETTVGKLMRDPSLRNNDNGRQLLRLLQATSTGAEQLPQMSALVPPHCVLRVAQVARQHARAWQDFATELSRRGRITDPTAR